MLRRAIERLSHGVTIKSRLPERFGNFPIIVSPDARLGFWRRNVEQIDHMLLSVAEEFVASGNSVWDIGANVGLYTLPSARAVGPSGQVVAFEPMPRNLGFLRRHLTLNGLEGVMVRDVAVSDATGTLTMAEGDSPISDEAVPIPWQNAVTRPSVCSQISRPRWSRCPGMMYGLLN